MSEVKKQLGEHLAHVVFAECPDALKEDLGLEPKLKGAGPNLWVSPSDLLIGKVCLKPPLTDKHIKALTHEGIIAIGNEIERKFWNEMEMEKEKALKEQSEYLRSIAEHERRVAVKMARDEEIAKCEKYVEELRRQFEEQLALELDKLTEEMLAQQDQMIQEAVEDAENSWQLRLEEAVEETVNRLTKQFLNDLETQKKELEAAFRIEFERQNTEFDYATNQENQFCQNTMKQLRHCLECKNIANLMYVLCMERRKCSIERSILEYMHKNKIEELNETIKENTEKIRVLTEERDQKQRQINIREICVVEILKQFQKFINYALRATPTQAEFLLDVRKMMLFEITQAIVKNNKERAQHLARRILPWKSDSETTSESSMKSRLTLKDYHDCLNETDLPEAQNEDLLPAFYYDNKLYVSEDFRLMVAKGVSLSSTNILWNKDVENLIQILKAAVTKKEEEEKKSLSSDEPSEGEVSDVPPVEMAKSDEIEEQSKSTRSRKSSSSFVDSAKKSVLKYSVEKINQPMFYCSINGSMEHKSVSKETIIKKIIKGSIEGEIAPLDTTGLLAARDSLVKIRESRKSSLREMPSYGTEEIETNNMLMAVRESLETKVQAEVNKSITEGSVNFENLDAIRIPDQLEIKKANKSSKGSIVKTYTPKVVPPRESILVNSAKMNSSRESKLLYAVDSLIIHRNSIVPSSFIRKYSTPGHDEQPIQSHVLKSSSRRDSVISKLSVARDSLELIRKQSALSKSKVLDDDKPSPTIALATVQDGYHSLSRRISPLTTSRVEIARIPTMIPETSVNFSPIKEIYETNIMKTSDSPWKIYAEQPEIKEPSRDNFLTKHNKLKITGSKGSKEHLRGSPSFTVNRINSIMDILRDEPSLIRLFTSCTK